MVARMKGCETTRLGLVIYYPLHVIFDLNTGTYTLGNISCIH